MSVGTFLASQRSHLNDAFLYYLRKEIFSFFHSVLKEEPYFPYFYFSCVCTTYICIRACCCRASSDIYYHTACTAQHSTAQSTRTSSKASTRRSDRDNASKQNELARARMSSSLHTARCVLKTNKKSKSSRPSKLYSHSQRSLAVVMREGFACTLLFIFTVVSISPVHGSSGLFSWTMELLAFENHQFTRKTMDLSVRFMHSRYVQLFLVSERSGRRKPPAKRRALYLV